MASKMRVRELSAELGMSNKEMIQLLRNLNIQVKSHMSGLTDDDVLKVREKVQKQSAEEVKDKKSGSGVIVRRRKKQPRRTGEEHQDQGTASEHHPPETAEHTEAKPEPGAEGKDDSHSEKTPPEAEEAPASPEKKKRDKKKKRSEDKQKKASEPKVRVISKPEVESQPEAESPEESPAASEDVSQLSPEEIARKQIKAEETKGEEGKSKKEKKKKGKKKDKRVVDVSDRYAPGEEAEKGKKSQKKTQKESPSPDKTGGKSRKPQDKSRKQEPPQPQPQQQTTQPLKASKRKLKIDEAIRVSDLAKQMGVKAQDIIKSLLSLGIMATINQSVDIETASVIADEYGFEVENVGFSEEEFILPRQEDKEEETQPRPPVVTIMGHVDHGKTSLLDSIRHSDIIGKETGGITQHIGAYYVSTPGGDLVFLDTPGHEAFTAMRARGAQVTDVVILVVAADDGVMDQTREALNHSKAAGVPIVVAVNKTDKEGANPDRVKRELAERGLVPEDWGGDTIFSHVSAKQQSGIDELLEMVLLQSEVLELKANPDKPAQGHIVEARLDKGRGPMATVLVEGGTLRQGEPFVCGLHHGKVRAMFNDQGKKVKEAGPATPIEVQGFSGVPEAGDEFAVVQEEKVARKISESRQTKQRERDLAKESKITLESFLAAKQEGEAQNLNLVLKSDVQGSLEATIEALNKLSTKEVKVNIIHGGAGAITESDIMLASASSAIIIGFNVRPTAKIREVADREQVEIRFYDIIYNMVNDIRDAMAGMLAPIIREQYLGQAEVLQTFGVPKVGTVAGCKVADGKLQRNAKVRLLRDGVVIHTGAMNSLKRFKDDVKEVAKGYECGVGLEKYNDIKPGDTLEAFLEVEEKATL